MVNSPGHRALRQGRVSLEGQIYLITFATRHRRRVFLKFEYACSAARTLTNTRYWLGAGVLCWVLMPDHWHGLVQLGQGHSLTCCVGRAKAASALGVNQLSGREGALWQRAFHDHALRRGEDLKGVARYIIANPLRAGLVDDIADYPFWDAVWL